MLFPDSILWIYENQIFVKHIVYLSWKLETKHLSFVSWLEYNWGKLEVPSWVSIYIPQFHDSITWISDLHANVALIMSIQTDQSFNYH